MCFHSDLDFGLTTHLPLLLLALLLLVQLLLLHLLLNVAELERGRLLALVLVALLLDLALLDGDLARVRRGRAVARGVLRGVSNKSQKKRQWHAKYFRLSQ